MLVPSVCGAEPGDCVSEPEAGENQCQAGSNLPSWRRITLEPVVIRLNLGRLLRAEYAALQNLARLGWNALLEGPEPEDSA